MVKTNKQTGCSPGGEPTFSKAQLIAATTLAVPRDVLAALLEDEQQYTKDQAISLVNDFLERRV